MLRRIGWVVAGLGALALGGAVLWLRFVPAPAPAMTTVAPPAAPTVAAAGPTGSAAAGPPALSRDLDCRAGPGRGAEAAANAASLDAADWAPSGRQEAGWSAYAPLAAREVRTACHPASTAFAERLAAWRLAHGLGPGGVMDAPTVKALVVTWLLRRPFVQATRRGECPPAPDPAGLATALPGETMGGKAVQAAPSALEAWRRLRGAARAERAEIAADPGLLAIASGFRGPEEEAARCAERGCDTVSRSRCSAHRTGTAFDLVLTTAPGAAALSTAEADRKALVRTPAYLWMVANADRFGFLPYPYEPWHWEWAGAALTPQAAPP